MKIRPLFLTPLCILTGASPVLAQVPVKVAGGIAKSGATTALEVNKASPRALRAINTISKRLVTGPSTVSKVANIPTVPVGIATIELGKYASLRTGWASRTQTVTSAQKAPAVTPAQTAQFLQEPAEKAFSALTPAEKEYMVLYGYPAAAIESPLVLSQKQIDFALQQYEEIIATPARENFFEDWGKLMSAITNIGFFGTAQDANLVLAGAKKMNRGILTGPTDIIAVRALLNLHAYDKIQELANDRLAAVDGNGNPLLLPYEWGEIQRYMHEKNLNLTIKPQQISPAPEKSALSRIPTAEFWLGHYNSYNLFAADPSAETTADWLNLRRGMEEKALSIDIRRNVDTYATDNKSVIVLTSISTPKSVQTHATPKVFTPSLSREAAAQQAALTHSAEQLQEIAKQQESLLRQINAGYISVRYNISPRQKFYPYEQAVLRAEAEGNQRILKSLKRLEGTTESLLSSQTVVTAKLGLSKKSAEEAANTIASVFGYIQDTTIMMYLGYSWGEKPLQEVTVPAKYHTSRFNQQINEFLLNHPEFTAE